MYIGTARNKVDIEEAISLAANIFQKKKLARDGVDIKRALMQAGRKIKRKDIVLIANNESKILACCFLIDKIFQIRGLECKGTFLTSIAVRDGYRGEGLSRLLMGRAIEECGARLSTIAILIARKSVDFFYNKFEFWGISSYSKISIQSAGISSSKKIKKRGATPADFKKVNNLYKKTYSNLLGSVKRFKDDWEFIKWKAEFLKAKFIIFENYKGEVLGYTIYKENKIYEISVNDEYKYIDLLYSLGLKSSYEEIILCIGADHPLVKQLENIDFSLIQRSCPYGGHMVRVLDKKLLTSLMFNDVKNNLEYLKVSDYQFSHSGTSIHMKKGELSLNVTDLEDNCVKTCLLLGADIIGSDLNTKYLLSLRQFNVLELDQV